MEIAMKTKIILPLAAAAVALAPMSAFALTGFTDESTSLRAGPDSDAPRITRMPKNARIEVHGCIRRYDWCDVSYQGTRGWVDSDDVEIAYQGARTYLRERAVVEQVPVVRFEFDRYWDDYYRGHVIYKERDTYRTQAADWYNDADMDGVPNRYDRDMDGDGERNSLDRDRDGDGLRNKRDPMPNTPN
jgi:uncharacterized protein YraI